MLLKPATKIFACTPLLLSFSWTSFAYRTVKAVSFGLDNRLIQDQHTQQCNSLCSMRHANDATKCNQSHGPTSRFLAACMSIIDKKRDDCRGKCDTDIIPFQDCLETCRLQLPNQFRSCNSSVHGVAECISITLARGKECESQCGIQFEMQSKTADDRSVCYTRTLDILRLSNTRCLRASNAVMEMDCQISCITSIQISSDYCDLNFPVDNRSNPDKVQLMVPELAWCRQ